MTDERTRRIQERAHFLWEQEGHPYGRDAEHWSQAEREIDAEDAAGASPAATTDGRRQAKRRAGQKTIADTSGESRGDTSGAALEVSGGEPMKTRGRKPKAVMEDGTEAPKAARGRKAKAVTVNGAVSSTAAGDAEPKADPEEATNPNVKAAKDAELPGEPIVDADTSRTAE